MRKEDWRTGEWSKCERPKVLEVITGMKHIAVVVDLCPEGEQVLGLYRPEKGISLSVDQNIPKPSELYRDVAFYRYCDFLEWEGIAPVFPWRLNDNDKGVIRPYWREIKNMEVYHFNKALVNGESGRFWRQLAMADYIFGVGDRVSNDFLRTPDGLYVVDSGFSFLPGEDFYYQQSIVRDLCKGQIVDNDLLRDLGRLDRNLSPVDVAGLVGEAELFWVKKRVERVLSDRKFL